MTRIDDLIAEFCSAGVPFAALGTLLEYEQPTKYLVDSTSYDDSYPTPVLTAGQTFILGYTDETSGIYPASPESPVVIFDDFTTAFKWVDFRFKAKSSAMKMLKPKRDAPVELRFVYFAMQGITYRPQDHARQWIGTYSGFRIPVPPLEVQREIVRMLDNFIELQAELEAEREARRRQYRFYGSLLLDRAAKTAEFVELGQLGRIVTGRTPNSSDSGAWGSEFDFVTPSDIRDGMMTVSEPSRRLSEAGVASMSRVLIPAGSLLVTCIGADMGKTVINANECVPNQQINAIIPTEGIHNGYMFHVLTSMRESLRAHGERGGGTMPIINKKEFSRIKAPVPPIAIQKEAAAQLDRLHALVNDVHTGIPAELAARRRQYGFYRDRLLTFEEAAV